MGWFRIDKGTGEREPVTERRARQAAEDYHHNADIAMGLGHFYSPFFIYIIDTPIKYVVNGSFKGVDEYAPDKEG